MVLYVITIIFVLCARYLKKRRGLSISSLMWIWYAIMYAASILLVSFYDRDIPSGFGVYIYMAVVLFILLIPFCSINDNNVKTLILPSEKWLNLSIVIFTIGSLLAVCYYIPSAIKVLSVDMAEIERTRAIIGSTGENPFIQRSLTNTIASIFSTFFMLQIVFFFITIIKEGRLSWRSILILVSSTSYIFLVLSFMGRDGFVFWGLSFFFLYVFFSKFIDSRVKRKIKRLFIIIMSFSAVVFLIITIGRFLYSSDSDFLYPFVSYMGQGPINFPELFTVNIIPTGGSGIFSLIVGDADNMISNHNQIIYYQHDISTSIFRTIVGSLYQNFGLYGTIVFAIISCVLILCAAPKNKRQWDFSFIIIYILYVMIMYQGVFYYKLYDNASNLYVVLSFFMAIVYKLLPKQKISIQK